RRGVHRCLEGDDVGGRVAALHDLDVPRVGAEAGGPLEDFVPEGDRLVVVQVRVIADPDSTHGHHAIVLKPAHPFPLSLPYRSSSASRSATAMASSSSGTTRAGTRAGWAVFGGHSQFAHQTGRSLRLAGVTGI